MDKQHNIITKLNIKQKSWNKRIKKETENTSTTVLEEQPESNNRIVRGWRKYWNRRHKMEEHILFRLGDSMVSLIMAILAVIPLMVEIYQKVPFSFEVNDDATIMQIVDGSYTGTPDAHAIFIRYPLSWIMTQLYKKNPTVDIAGLHLTNVNWYVGTIVFLEIFALVAVLFRLLCYLKYNRIIICILYDLAFLAFWLPCYANMTFSTAAAFMGCMGLLFFAFETRDQAWRPWNLLALAVILITCWCLRKPCLYMILPFLCIELVVKYHIYFFRSVKPWMVFSIIGALFAGVIYLNNVMYGSQQWKTYYIYNHDRAYLQDYAGFPEYSKNKDFYQNLGINENERDAMAHYTYCLVDDFSTDWVEKTYVYVKNQETEEKLTEKLKNAGEKAYEYQYESKNTSEELRNAPFYFELLAVPLLLLTLIFSWFWKKKWLTTGIDCICNAIRVFSMPIVLSMEWRYLASNGRFPQRVEETIRLLSLTVGIMLICQLLKQWEHNPFTHIPVIIQLAVLYMFIQHNPMPACIAEVAGTQQYYLQYASEKQQIVDYCGDHPDAVYILETPSFTKVSRPSDNFHQGNWYMSGSWTAYSPLYEEKLEKDGIQSLGTDFLKQDNVYIITKGKKNISSILGLSENQKANTEIVDEIVTDSNNFYEVYRLKGIEKAD